MSGEPFLQRGLVLLGRYRVDERLARGGFGEVYRAFDMRIERDVALKYIFQILDPETLRNEVSILARNAERLKFIPNIYDHWQGDDGLAGYFIVMEFIAGETLDTWRRLPWGGDQVAEFLGTMLRNLRDLHRSQIVHCDIKPVNIKVVPQSDLAYQVPYRILDFGIAKQGDQTTIPASTPHFAAPEQQIHGKRRVKLDQRVDLYSLAATAYYLLTAQLPTRADFRYASVYEHRYGDPLPPPGALAPDVHPGLEQTLLEMMQIDRERRPRSAEDALQRLTQRLSGASQTTEPETAPSEPDAGPDTPQPPLVTELTDVPISSNPLPPSASITPAALLRAAPAPPARSTVHVEPLEDDLPQLGEVARVGRGFISGIAWAPDGRELLVATSLGVYRLPTYGGACRLWHAAPGARHAGYVLDGRAVLVASDGGVEALRPDGDLDPSIAALPARGALLTAPQGQVVAALDDATLRVFSLPDGAQAAAWKLTDRLQGQVVALAADGRTIAIGDGDRIWCHALGPDRRGPRSSLRDLPEPMTDLALTPDGALAAIATPSGALVWSCDSEGAQLVAQDQAPIARIALTGDGQTLAAATDAGVTLQRAGDGRRQILHEGGIHGVRHLAFCPADRLLAAASDGEVRVWRLRDGGLQLREAEWAYAARAVAPLDGGLVTAGRDVRVWSRAGAELTPGAPLLGQSGVASAVAASDDGRAAVAGAAGVRVVDLGAHREVYAVAAQPAQAHSLAFTDAGLAVVTREGIERYDAAGEALGALPTLDPRAVDHVALSAGCAAVGSAGRVIILGMSDGAERCVVRPRGAGEITAVALGAGGAVLAIAHRGAIALYRVDTDRPERLAQRQLAAGPPVHRLVFAADGTRLVALRGAELELWEAGEGDLRLVGVARGHAGDVEDAAVLPDRTVASVARDGTVRLWRAAEGEQP